MTLRAELVGTAQVVDEDVRVDEEVSHELRNRETEQRRRVPLRR